MQEHHEDMKVAEEAIERLETEMESRGVAKPKKKNKQRAIQGRKAALASRQSRHYETQVRRVREKNPRFKGFRSTVPTGGPPPQVGPSEKALARAARQS